MNKKQIIDKIKDMKELLKTWRLRMVKYRQEADNAKSPITRVKAMNKFFVYRDCIKELEKAINYTHCCESDSEQLADHKCKPMVNADWTYLRCECGKRFKPKG